MGQKHKTVLQQLKKKSEKSAAFSYSVTAYNYCSYMKLNNEPISVLYERIMDCVAAIQHPTCRDTHYRKQHAIKACWDAYREVTTHFKWKALKDAKGVKNANKLDLSMPEDGGNAIGPAVRRPKEGGYVRPIQALTRGCENIFYGAIPDEDDDATHFDSSLRCNQQFTWEDSVIDDGEEEYIDENGERRFRPDLNGPCF